MATFPLRAVGHGDRLTLTGHLGELRTRLVVCAAALTVLFAGCLWQSRALLDVLDRPLSTVRAAAGTGPAGAVRAPEQATLAELLTDLLNG
jgi:Sec-independent protein secretion pathway component TatC